MPGKVPHVGTWRISDSQTVSVLSLYFTLQCVQEKGCLEIKASHVLE